MFFCLKTANLQLATEREQLHEIILTANYAKSFVLVFFCLKPRMLMKFENP